MSEPYAEANRLGREADTLYNTDVPGALKLYRQAWDAVPEPKGDWDGVTWIWGMIAGEQMKQRQFRDAIESLGHVERSPHVVRASRPLFDLGRAHFELGEMEQARDYFQRAWDVSEGRAFRGENPKYLKLLKPG